MIQTGSFTVQQMQVVTMEKRQRSSVFPARRWRAARSFAAIAIPTVVCAFVLAGCAAKQPGTVPAGPIDPSTGVVKPDDGSIPFYPGDISLRSVPSMPRVPKHNPAVRINLWHEELIGREGAHLFARNETDVPMRITKVSVYECENIEGGCIDYDPNMVLQPREKRRLYTIVPLLKNKAYRYRWRASSAQERPAATPVAPPRATPASSPGSTPAASTQAAPSTQPTPSAPPASGTRAAAPPASAPARTTPIPPPPSGNTLTGDVNSSATGNPMDRVGATLRLTANGPGERSVKSIMPHERYRSRHMQLTADIDARGVNYGKGVTIWMQAESPDGTLLTESSAATRVKGTATGHLKVTMSVPANATSLIVGMKLDGVGSVTATAFKIREVGTGMSF
jgi:hypothetical protein